MPDSPVPNANPTHNTGGIQKAIPTAGASLSATQAVAADASSPAHSQSAGLAPSRVQSKDPESLEEFVAYAYSRKGKRLSLKKKTALAIAQQPPPGESFLVQLRALAQKDMLLTVPRQLLLAALPHRNNTKAWSLILEVVSVAIRANPGCSAFAACLHPVGADEGTCDDMIAEAAHFRIAQVEDPLTKKPISKSQIAALHHNLVVTVALWTVAVRSSTTNNAVQSLFVHVWKGEARQRTSAPDAWRHLLDLRDPVLPGIIGNVFVDEALRQQQLAADATARLVTEQKRADDLATELAASRTALSNAETSISQLQEKMAQALRDHQTAVSHLRDDFERLRTRVLRRLSRELDLLDEGMGALRREPPKLHVMLDHGERATSGLREEIKSLEREAPR